MADILFIQIPNENLRAGTDLLQTSGREMIGASPGRYVSDGLATSALLAAHPRFVARSSNGRNWRALPEAGLVPVELGGAKGDGTTDDGPAIRAAFAYASAIGARGVRFGSARYRAEQMLASQMPAPGNPPVQLLGSNPAVLDYGGAELTRQGAGRSIVWYPEYAGPITDLLLGEDVVAGSRELVLQPASTGQLEIGDTVVLQLGELPYDTPEPTFWSFAKVEALTDNRVRLDTPVPEAFALSAITGPNKRLRKLAVLSDCVIRDLTLSGTGIEDGLSLSYARRVHIARVNGNGLGAGTVVAQYCDGLTIEDCWQDGAHLTQASFGFAFSFAETRNSVLVRPGARATLGLVKAEAGAEVSVVGGCFDNTIVDAAGQPLGAAVTVILAVGRASVSVRDLTVTGHGGYRLTETSNGQLGFGGSVRLSGITRLRHPSSPHSIPVDAISGQLELDIAGARESYDFDRLRHWKRRFALRDGEFTYAFGPAGILVRARAFTSAVVTVGSGQQLPGFWIGRQGDNGSNVADGTTRQLESGQEVHLPCFGGLVAGTQWLRRNEPMAILCVTAPQGGLNTANGFVEFEGWFAQRTDLDVPRSDEAVRNSDDCGSAYEAEFVAHLLPPVPGGSSVAVDLPIAPMTSNHLIDAVRLSGGFAGLELRHAEARAGAARLVIANPGSSTITPAAGDLAIAYSRSALGT